MVIGVSTSVAISSTVTLEVILVMFWEDAESHFLAIYSCFMEFAIASKSSFRITFIENIFVHESVIAVMVLSPLVHLFVREMSNCVSEDLQELIVMLLSFVVHDVTPGHLIGRTNVSVAVSE